SAVCLTTTSSSLLYRHGHLPDLRSFPTRRSSDLGTRRSAHPGVRPSPREVPPEATMGRRLCGSRPVPDRETRCSGFRAGPEKRRDRKSTRLNSSHVSISYAVFCLKKKNNANLEEL